MFGVTLTKSLSRIHSEVAFSTENKHTVVSDQYWTLRPRIFPCVTGGAPVLNYSPQLLTIVNRLSLCRLYIAIKKHIASSNSQNVSN